jgi:hypothetical protein
MIATEEQATIRDMARRFAADKLAPNAASGIASTPFQPKRSERWANSASWA